MKERNNSLKGEWWFWIGVHLLAWSLVPTMINPSLHLDTIEALAWGQEWAWGYDKHPPLSAWAAEIFGYLPGDWGLYLLSQLCIVGAGLGVWKLGRDFGLSKESCLLGVILLDALYFYQYASPEFNVNYLQLPFWAWGWWAGFRGVKTGRIFYWVGLGLMVGLGALTKYLAVFLVIPFLASLWEQKRLLEQLRRPGLYLAGFTSMLVFLPHLLWMRENDWMTLTYGLARAEGNEMSFLLKRILFPLEFLGVQFLVLLPLLLFGYWNRNRDRNEKKEAPDESLEKSVAPPIGLRGLCLGGFLLVGVLSAIFGWQPVMMWAAPMPLTFGLWVATWVDPRKRVRAARWALAFGLVGLAAYLGVYGLSPRLRDRPHRVGYPGKELAAQVEALWREENQEPLSFVVAHEWEGGLVAWYGKDRASVVIEGDWVRTPYLDQKELEKKGAMVVWLKSVDSESDTERLLAEKLPEIVANFPEMERREDLLIPWPGRIDGKKGRYGVAVIQGKGKE